MTLKDAIEASRLGYRKISALTGISRTSLSRLVNYGDYPHRTDRGEVRDAILSALGEAGVDTHSIEFPPSGRRPDVGKPELRQGVLGNPIQIEELELMQLNRDVQGYFGLRQNPFLNDVESDEDVYVHKSYTDATIAIKETIEERGFLAMTAPSGAGKTTIWDGVESEYGGRDDVVLCKTQIKNKERLTPEHLSKALIYGLSGDDARIAQDAEDRGRQLSRVLRALRSGNVDKRAILYIDDAHFCNQAVLRQLKTFFEEKIGRYRLLAIILVGLPQLKEKLSLFPEIGNRIRVMDLKPTPVQPYLDFKLKRIGSGIDKLFAADGLDAFLDRFRMTRRAQAMGWPLIVNTAAIRAMVLRYESSGGPGERITREIIDRLPGGAAQPQTGGRP
jgi:type II secretory pathway predicted ATPase ExeA